MILTNVLPVSAIMAQTSEKIPVIITFKGKTNTALIRAFGGDIKYDYSLITAVACSLPRNAIDALIRNPMIAQIEYDEKLSLINSEILPWGVDRIDAELVHTSNKGTGVNVSIIDTGIDYNHLDLAANYKGGYDFVNDDPYPLDDNGHGTHCAGIVAAVDNDIGVIGVAPEAYLYAVKVLDSTGSGWLSDVVGGIQWATTNHMQVISMSLGSDSGISSLETACNAAYEAGVLVVAAAGNDYKRLGRTELDTVDYPARYDSVIAVGAIDSSDIKASFSSTGSALELAAPGVSIPSTYLDNSYVYMSGTSMACPHVAGIAALVFASGIDTDYDSDGDGKWNATEVRMKLRDTADDLGSTGWDKWYGYGLVDADEAASTPSVDTTPPNISDLTPSNGSIINTNTPTISAKVTDASGIGSISMTLNGNKVNTTYDSSTDLVYYTPSFLEDGLYSVNLAVSDLAGKIAFTDWSFTIDTTVPEQLKMHVQNITMSIGDRYAGKNHFVWATAHVTVVDASGNPLAGIAVYGHWEGATSDSDSGITPSSGQIALSSDSVKNLSAATFTFVIDNLVLSGYIYDSINSKTEGTINYP